jgi:NADP-dependent 3-hydroxy acid dehydrogenase YdfG
MTKGNQSMGNKLLSNKTAMVTGASSGIGRAVVLALAKAAAAVVIHARRKERLVIVFNRIVIGEEE